MVGRWVLGVQGWRQKEIEAETERKKKGNKLAHVRQQVSTRMGEYGFWDIQLVYNKGHCHCCSAVS